MYKNFWGNFLNASPMTFSHPTFLPPPYKLNIQFRWKKSYNPSKIDTYLNFNFLKNKIKKSKITKSYNFIFSSFFFSVDPWHLLWDLNLRARQWCLQCSNWNITNWQPLVRILDIPRLDGLAEAFTTTILICMQDILMLLRRPQIGK